MYFSHIILRGIWAESSRPRPTSLISLYDIVVLLLLCIDNILKLGPVISNSSDQHVWNTKFTKVRLPIF